MEFETYFDSDIDKNGIEDKNNMEEVKTIFLAILNLVEGRYDALTKVYNEEYNIESLRKSFVQYITNILKEDNYLSYRYSINSKHNTLLNDIVQSYKKVSFDIYKKEINSILVITEIFVEERFYNRLWEIRSEHTNRS